MKLAYYARSDVLYAVLDPAQFRDDRVRFVVALRNEATVSGECPVCGATAPMPNRAARRRARGTVLQRVMTHEAECPCGDDRLRELVEASGEAA